MEGSIPVESTKANSDTIFFHVEELQHWTSGYFFRFTFIYRHQPIFLSWDPLQLFSFDFCSPILDLFMFARWWWWGFRFIVKDVQERLGSTSLKWKVWDAFWTRLLYGNIHIRWTFLTIKTGRSDILQHRSGIQEGNSDGTCVPSGGPGESIKGEESGVLAMLNWT